MMTERDGIWCSDDAMRKKRLEAVKQPPPLVPDGWKEYNRYSVMEASPVDTGLLNYLEGKSTRDLHALAVVGVKQDLIKGKKEMEAEFFRVGARLFVMVLVHGRAKRVRLLELEPGDGNEKRHVCGAWRLPKLPSIPIPCFDAVAMQKKCTVFCKELDKRIWIGRLITGLLITTTSFVHTLLPKPSTSHSPSHMAPGA